MKAIIIEGEHQGLIVDNINQEELKLKKYFDYSDENKFCTQENYSINLDYKNILFNQIETITYYLVFISRNKEYGLFAKNVDYLYEKVYIFFKNVLKEEKKRETYLTI